MSFQFTDICYVTPDVMKLRTFYETVFCAKADGDEYHSFISVGGLNLTFDWVKHLAEDPVFGYVSGERGSNAIICFNVDDVDSEYRRLTEMGIETLNEPTTHPWGARSFQFKDTDGNILNFRSLAG